MTNHNRLLPLSVQSFVCKCCGTGKQVMPMYKYISYYISTPRYPQSGALQKHHEWGVYTDFADRMLTFPLVPHSLICAEVFFFRHLNVLEYDIDISFSKNKFNKFEYKAVTLNLPKKLYICNRVNVGGEGLGPAASLCPSPPHSSAPACPQAQFS